MTDCLFCKIRDKEIPADIVYSDEHCLAFRDINAAAPTHILVIPRTHIATLNDITPEHGVQISAIFNAIGKIARDSGVAEDGFRIVANCNEWGGQQVYHIHFHLLGGRQLQWPPG